MTHRTTIESAEHFEDHCWRDVIDAATLNTYTAYVRDTWLEPPWAVVCVDPYLSMFPSRRMPVEEALRENPRSCGEFAWDAREPMRQVLDLARAAKAPIVVTTSRASGVNRTTNRPASADPRSDFRIAEEFLPAEGETLVEKDHASAFLRTGLEEHLRSLGIETVVVTGASTSGCVRATVVDARSLDFHVVVVEEAVFDRSALIHKVNLFDMHHKYADVVTLESLIRAVGEPFGAMATSHDRQSVASSTL